MEITNTIIEKFKYEVSFPIETLLVSGNNYIENRCTVYACYKDLKQSLTRHMVLRLRVINGTEY